MHDCEMRKMFNKGDSSKQGDRITLQESSAFPPMT